MSAETSRSTGCSMFWIRMTTAIFQDIPLHVSSRTHSRFSLGGLLPALTTSKWNTEVWGYLEGPGSRWRFS